MKYRLAITFLASLLLASVSFNFFHYHAWVQAEEIVQIERDVYDKLRILYSEQLEKQITGE